jgi:hypothetical protein
VNEDQEHLRILSIFYYVVAGISGLFALFPFIHLFAGFAILGAEPQGDLADSRFMGGFFIVIASLAILLGLTYALALVLTGRNLANREHYTFCLVVAGVSCMFAPIGTVLGVFTIVVLMRSSVRELFESASARGQEAVTCLSCGSQIPPETDRCLACGWSFSNAGDGTA